MCDPLTLGLATFAISGTQQVAQFQGQQAQAVQARANANAEFRSEFEALGRRSTEIEQAQSEERFDLAIQAQREQGRIAAAGASAGLSATSLGQQLRVATFEEGRSVAASERQNEFDQRQIQVDADAAASRQQSILDANRGPNPLNLLLGIGSSALGGASTFANAGGRLPGSGLRG